MERLRGGKQKVLVKEGEGDGMCVVMEVNWSVWML